MLCDEDDETVIHFLLECNALEPVRESIIYDINASLHDSCGVNLDSFSNIIKIKVILDSTSLSMYTNINLHNVDLSAVEFHTHRLCHFLHCARYKMLQKVPSRRKRGGRDTR